MGAPGTLRSGRLGRLRGFLTSCYCLPASKQEIGLGHTARREPPAMTLFYLACLLAVLPGASARSQPTPCRIQSPGDTEIWPIPRNALLKRCTPSRRNHTDDSERSCLKMDWGSETRMAVSHFKARVWSSLGIIKRP